MDLQDSWTITRKDFSIFRKKSYVIYSLVAVPLIVSILLPVVLQVIVLRRNVPPAALPAVVEQFLGAFSFFWVILAAVVPITLASYSIVGEKVEKSLEPLLATPLTDNELLLGKSLAAFLPALASMYVGVVIYMVLADFVTQGVIGYPFFPNWDMATILLLIPLACLLSVEVSIILSSRVNDVRASQQLGFLTLIPFAAIYVSLEVNLIEYNTTNLLIICAIVLVANVALFFLTRSIFGREEILTKWK